MGYFDMKKRWYAIHTHAQNGDRSMKWKRQRPGRYLLVGHNVDVVLGQEAVIHVLNPRRQVSERYGQWVCPIYCTMQGAIAMQFATYKEARACAEAQVHLGLVGWNYEDAPSPREREWREHLFEAEAVAEHKWVSRVGRAYSDLAYEHKAHVARYLKAQRKHLAQKAILYLVSWVGWALTLLLSLALLVTGGGQ